MVARANAPERKINGKVFLISIFFCTCSFEEARSWSTCECGGVFHFPCTSFIIMPEKNAKK